MIAGPPRSSPKTVHRLVVLAAFRFRGLFRRPARTTRARPLVDRAVHTGAQDQVGDTGQARWSGNPARNQRRVVTLTDFMPLAGREGSDLVRIVQCSAVGSRYGTS